MKPFDVYPLLDIEPVEADGSYIFTGDGKKYLDFYGGHAVISVGHSHPHYVQRISSQLNKIGFYSNSVQNSLQHVLAEKLGELSGYEDYQLFLSNSGAEANENALKMASFHTGKSKIIAFKNAFHGRTSAAVSITDNSKYSAPVNKGPEVTFLELNDTKALKNELKKGDVCAVIVEGMQGVAGINIPDDEFLRQAAEHCSRHNAVFICDEVQSGYGRTGRFFAHQYAGVRPDIITVAKGMGNGFPIAGTLLHPKFEPVYSRLGTTFGGNHLACAAGLAVLEILEDEQLVNKAYETGKRLVEKLSGLPMVKEVRGRGLMIGIVFDFPVKSIRKALIEEKQIMTGISSDPHVLRILPPLTITRQQADTFIDAFREVLESEFLASK